MLAPRLKRRDARSGPGMTGHGAEQTREHSRYAQGVPRTFRPKLTYAQALVLYPTTSPTLAWVCWHTLFKVFCQGLRPSNPVDVVG